MNKTHKKLALLALTSLSVCFATIVVSISNFGGAMLPAIKAENIDSTLVFSKNDSVSYSSKKNSEDNSKYDNTIVSKTGSGSYYECLITKSTTDVALEGNLSMGTLDSTSKLSVTCGYSSKIKTFQKITSIKVYTRSTASRTIRLYFNGSDGEYSTLSVPARSGDVEGQATFDTSSLSFIARSFELVYSTPYSYTFSVSKLEIGYECSTEYIDEAVLESISLNTSAVKKSFTVGDTFTSDGLVVTAYYSDLTTNTVVPTSISTPDMSTSGTKTVTVTYTEGNVTKTATYDIEVEEASEYFTVSPGTYTTNTSYCGSFTLNNDGSGVYSRSQTEVNFTWSCIQGVLNFTFDSEYTASSFSYLPCLDSQAKFQANVQITLTADDAFSLTMTRNMYGDISSVNASYDK